MKLLAKYSLLLILVITYDTIVVAQAIKSGNSPVSSTAQQSSADMPQTFSSPECNFTIGLPGTQLPKQHSFKNKDGLPLNSYSFIWITNVGTYNLRCTETATTVSDSVISNSSLNRLRDLLLSKNTAKLTRDVEIAVDGFPGREIFLEDTNGIYIQRFYLIGQRAFDLNVYSRDGKPEPGAIRSGAVQVMRRMVVALSKIASKAT